MYTKKVCIVGSLTTHNLQPTPKLSGDFRGVAKKSITLLFVLFSFFLFFFILPRNVYAATYYVRTDGNDTNCSGLIDAADPGSGNIPRPCAWTSISKVNSATYASGDSVLFKRGQSWSGTQLVTKSNVTYGATDESGSKPLISNSGTRTVFLSSVQGVTVQDLNIQGSNAALQVNSSGNTSQITVNRVDTSNATSYNIYIYESLVTINDSTATGAQPFTFATAASPTITTNATCNRCTATGSALTASGFIAQNAAIVTINDSVSYSNKEDGFSASNTGSLTCNRCKAYNNGDTSRASSGDGFTSHDTSTLNVRYSIAYGNYKSGVAVTGASNGEILNSSFYNNVESTNGSGWDGGGDVGIGINATGAWTIKNNITYGHPVEFMITSVAVPGGASVTSNYNLFYDSLGGSAFDYNGIFYNFSGFKTASGKDTNSLNTNPFFRDVSSSNFLLLPTSPAINAGTDVSLTTDYAGNSVPQGSASDIGAYEFLLPSLSSSLSQNRSDGTSTISTGGALGSGSTVVFKLNMSSPNNSDSLTPQVEVQPIGATFTNSPNYTGSVVAYSGTGVTGTVTASSFGSSSYHWQARVSNSAGQGSWTSFGGNSESEADFSIDFSASSVPACSDTAPGNAPWLYDAISESRESIRVYFTNAQDPVDRYVLEYGTEPGVYQFSSTNIGGRGTKTYLVELLSPGIMYYFRVRGSNGCATGTWSNEISGTTKYLATTPRGDLDIKVIDIELKKKEEKKEQAKEEGLKEIGYSVKIKVVDTDKKAVKGAKVMLFSTPREATTDDKGIALFKNVESGEHRVVVSYKQQTGEQKINLQENMEVDEIDFTIQIKSTNPFYNPWVIGVITALVLTLVGVILRAKSMAS